MIESPFLLSYVPYQTPTGTVQARGIEDMISYDVVIPQNPVTINYLYGARNPYQVTFRVKNITQNATLNVRLDVDTQTWDVVGLADKNITSNEIFEIRLVLGRRIYTEAQIQSSIALAVRNIENNELILKPLQTQLLPQRELPPIITIQ